MQAQYQEENMNGIKEDLASPYVNVNLDNDHIDSYYSRTLGNEPPYPELDEEVKAPVCVIGGGMAGLAAGCYAQHFHQLREVFGLVGKQVRQPFAHTTTVRFVSTRVIAAGLVASRAATLRMIAHLEIGQCP